MRYWIGFDVGKAFHCVCVLNAEVEVILSRRVEADERDMENCCQEIESLGAERSFGIDLLDEPAALLKAVLLGRGERVFYLPGTAVNRARDGYRGEHKSDRTAARVIADDFVELRFYGGQIVGFLHVGSDLFVTEHPLEILHALPLSVVGDLGAVEALVHVG